MSKYRDLKDILFKIAIAFFTFLAVFPLFHIVYTITVKGLGVILKDPYTFLFKTFSEGGIGPAIVGTLILIALSSLLGIPIAVLIGISIYENTKSAIGRWTKTLLQIMLEFPTILVGIFVMGTIVFSMGRYSALAGSIALAIIMIPYVAVYTHEALRTIPFTYKEAGYSLGLSRAKVLFRILVPMAKKGIITGILIGIARAAGETAPLLFTIGGLYESFPKHITYPIGAIPLLIYNLVQSPSPEDHLMAWGSAFTLMVIFFSIFLPIRIAVKGVKL